MKRLTKKELVELVKENQKKIIETLIKNNEFDDYKILEINGLSLKVYNNYEEKEENIVLTEKKIIEHISDFRYLNLIFDKLGFKEQSLKKVEDYDERVFELAKEIAKMKYKIEDYEFRITDGRKESEDLYYIVCWISKKEYEERKDYLKSNVAFKCASEYNGGEFIIELSEYPKFNYLLKRKWMDDEDYLYACYLTYLYTRNLERLDY